MKKLCTAFLAAITLTAAASLTSSAAGSYTFKDATDLSSYLLGDEGKGIDVNGDKIVNVFDLVDMRASFTSTGEFTETTVKADEEHTRFVGRNYIDENGVTWLVQSGSSVEFNVNARSASITLCGDASANNDRDYQSRYGILVDGELVADDMLGEKEKTIELFSGTEARSATIRITHLSEANQGAIGVSGITADSDFAIPVAPTQKKDLSIEFIGDSITCAYGVEGKDQYESFKTTTENFMKSYAYLTAKKLDADYSAVCYSGYGVISAYSNDGSANTTGLVPDYYEYIGRPEAFQKPWDFASHKNDVVVVNLGTNDNTYVSKEFETRSLEFTEGYVKFLKQIRKNNPDAYIICTLGTMGCTEEYPCIEEAVKQFKEDTGDTRIMSYQSETHTQSDGFGSDWHPNEGTQQRSAYVLADKICQALGMESDQLGLNVAADAVFSSDTSIPNGMSAYYSEWDNSYHVTVVQGGDSIDDITLTDSGIGLKKDGKYALSFSINTAEGAELPFVIKDSATGKVIFEDTFKGTGTQTEYSAEFTSPVTADADLVISMGGTDSLRVSLYQVKCVRIG